MTGCAVRDKPQTLGAYDRLDGGAATLGGGRLDVLQHPQGNGTDPVSIPAPPQTSI